jgi:hypothetical protein
MSKGLLSVIEEIVGPDGASVSRGKLKKWRDAALKAIATGKMANTLAKALARR